MATLASRISDVQAALDTLARQHRVPGATLGIMLGDEVVEFVTGVTNKNTGVPVTPTTLFQIGSNTKVYNAVLVMQLVDEGLVDLDKPVRTYLPALTLGDAKAAAKVTTRHLLTHTSGIEGDILEDFGTNDDGIERYVAALAKVGNIHDMDEMWSYSNAACVLAGHLVEKLRGEPYAKIFMDRLITPLGLKWTTVRMEEMLAHSCAVGHVIAAPGADPVVPAKVMMTPTLMPAGSMTTSTAAEVLAFARMHLDGGRARNGAHVVSAASVRAMQQPQAKMPPGIAELGTEMGLGWMLDEWDGERILSHGGNTIGTASYLKVVPDRRFAVTLLTNSVTGIHLWRTLGRFIFDEIAGIHMPERPKLPEEPPKVDLKRYEGRYARAGIEYELGAEDGFLAVKVRGTGPESKDSPPQEATMRPIDAELFVVNVAGAEQLAQFMTFDRHGRPRYLHSGARVNRRVEEGAPTKKSKAKTRPKAKAKTGARTTKKRSAGRGRTGRARSSTRRSR